VASEVGTAPTRKPWRIRAAESRTNAVAGAPGGALDDLPLARQQADRRVGLLAGGVRPPRTNRSVAEVCARRSFDLSDRRALEELSGELRQRVAAGR